MSATADALKLAPNDAAVKRGWPGLRCPYCGQADTLAVSLHTLELTCDNEDCGECFTPADVQHVLDQWEALVRWLTPAPRAGG